MSKSICEEDFIKALESSASKSTNIFIFKNREVVLVEVVDDDKREYLFVVFRGAQDVTELGTIIDEQVLSKPPAIPPAFFVDTCRSGKKTVVLTGYGTGGAQATLLANAVIEDNMSVDFRGLLYCITFGSPLVSNTAVTRYVHLHTQIFHNYILSTDSLTRAVVFKEDQLDIATAVEGLYGHYYVLEYQPDSSIEYKELISLDSLQAILDTVQSLSTLKSTLTESSFRFSTITQYYSALQDAILFPSLTALVDKSTEAATGEGAELSKLTRRVRKVASMKPDAKFATITLPVYKTFRYLPQESPDDIKEKIEVTEIDPSATKTVKIYGENLQYVYKCYINEIEYILSDHKQSHDTLQINLLSDATQMKWMDSLGFEDRVHITLINYLQQLAVIELPIKRVSNNANYDIFPKTIVSSIMPLTALVSFEKADENDSSNLIEYQLSTLKKQIKSLEDSIPIEFAFHIMAKTFDSTGQKSADVQKHQELLLMFLKRLAHIHIIDWKELISIYMIEIINKSLENLSNLSFTEENQQFEKLFTSAFSNAFKLHTDRFYEIYHTICAYTGERFFLTKQPKSLPSYWEFICLEKISVSIIFCYSAHYFTKDFLQGSSQASTTQCVIQGKQYTIRLDSIVTLNKSATFLMSKKAYIKLHKYTIIQCNDGGSISPAHAETVDENHKANDEIVRQFFLFEVIDESDKIIDKPLLLDLLKEVNQHIDDYQGIHIQAPSPVQTPYGMVGTSGSSSLVIPSIFLLTWLIFNRSSNENHKIVKVIKQFQDQFPKLYLNKIDIEYATQLFQEAQRRKITKNYQSVHILHKAANKTNSKLTKYIFGYRNNPRKRVIAILNNLLYAMRANYDRIGAPFFCGLTIKMLVYNEEQQLEPFFNFIPDELMGNNISKGAEQSTSSSTTGKITTDTTVVVSANSGASAAASEGESESADPGGDPYTPASYSISNLRTGRDFSANDGEAVNEYKQALIQSANQVCNALHYLAMMLDEMMIVSCQKMFETQREDKLEQAGLIASGLASVLPSIFYGSFKALQYLYTWNFQHIVDIEEQFYSLYHRVYYRGMSFQSYDELIQYFAKLVAMPTTEKTTPQELEEGIFTAIPPAVGDLSFVDVIRKAHVIFHGTVFEPLLNDRSIAVHVFFLKVIYHTHQLRELRKSFVTISLHGETNAGKTTLVKKLIGKNAAGEDIVKAKPGLNTENTTVFPAAYCNPQDPFTTIIDLPGCTDQDTMEIPALFNLSCDVSIFILRSSTPANPVGSLCTIIQRFLKLRNGPRLLCINGFDLNLFNCTTTTDIESQLQREIVRWGNSKAFQIEENPIPRRPLWACEEKRRLSHSIVYSFRAKDAFPVSIWFTAFEAITPNKEQIHEYLFTVDEVREWIHEVKEYLATP